MRWMAAFLLLSVLLAQAGAGLAADMQGGVKVYRIEHNASPVGLNVRSYYLDLIERLLADTTATYGPARLQKVPVDVPQARLLAQVQHGKLDLVWTTTSIQREAMVQPIRIPLDMGLTGQRALVIRTDRKAEFDAITDLSQLGIMKACQGAFWPDTAVLRAAGLRVVEMPWIDLAYPALHDGGCDYLPRALNEIDGEVAVTKDPKIMVYDRLLLVYSLPMYLFVAPDEPELARRLTEGLQKMVAHGELRRFMRDHPATSMIFPINRYQGARVFRLNNPDLPPETPLTDSRLWLDVSVQPIN